MPELTLDSHPAPPEASASRRRSTRADGPNGIAPSSAPRRRFCIDCGEAGLDDAHFCAACGAALRSPAATAQTSSSGKSVPAINGHSPGTTGTGASQPADGDSAATVHVTLAEPDSLGAHARSNGTASIRAANSTGSRAPASTNVLQRGEPPVEAIDARTATDTSLATSRVKPTESNAAAAPRTDARQTSAAAHEHAATTAPAPPPPAAAPSTMPAPKHAAKLGRVRNMPNAVNARLTNARPIRAIGLGAAGVLAALAVGALYVVVDPFDDSRDRARGELVGRTADLAAVLTDADRAQNLASIRRVGSAAHSRLAAFDASRQTLAGVSDDHVRSVGLAATDAEREVLAQLARLRFLRPESLDAWGQIEPAIVRARTVLADAAGDVRALELGGAVVADTVGVDRVAAGLDAKITAAGRKLTEWKHRYQRARIRQRADQRVVGRYASAIRNQLARYAGLRSELDAWLEREGAETLPYGRAEEFLSDAISNRQQVRDNLAAIQPPLILQAAQSRLETVLDQSLRAMENAVDGARECTRDPYCLGEDFRQTVDWREFMRASDEIGQRFPTARSAWERNLATKLNLIKHRWVPKAPNV